MVNVGEKDITHRIAKARGSIRMLPETVDIIRNQTALKGDVLQVARLAGIMGAKRTSELIPLCHGLPLESVQIDFQFVGDDVLVINATTEIHAKTGIEMEALTAVSIAALTIYDMCKAVDRSMEIEKIYLVEKSGGRSGHYHRE